jgi:hypothetical protein
MQLQLQNLAALELDWLNIITGFLLGIVGSLLTWKFARQRERKALSEIAKRLVGTWSAFDFGADSTLIPMQGAKVTIIYAPTNDRGNDSTELPVEARDEDKNGVRDHAGWIRIDEGCPRMATRIVIYERPGGVEVVVWDIVIVSDDLLYQYPRSKPVTDYEAHALQRQE